MITLLFGSTKFLNSGQGGVQVQGAEHVTKIDGVDGAISFEVVDGENEVCP